MALSNAFAKGQARIDTYPSHVFRLIVGVGKWNDASMFMATLIVFVSTVNHPNMARYQVGHLIRSPTATTDELDLTRHFITFDAAKLKYRKKWSM